MSRTIWHVALHDDWEAAQDSGVYAVSTRGHSVAEVGFVHASFDADQVRRIAAAIYADSGPLSILGISLAALERAGIEVRSEPGDPTDPSSERFPHVYGTLPVDAVVCVVAGSVQDGALFAPSLGDR